VREKASVRIFNTVAVTLFSLAHVAILFYAGIRTLEFLALSGIHPVPRPVPPAAAAPNWNVIAQISVLVSWGLALIYSVIAPILRRRLDLVSTAGSMYIMATMMVEALLPDDRRAIDAEMFLFYIFPVALPSLLAAIALHGRLPRTTTPGVCPVCGYDRRGLTKEAACPECGSKP
jgi:hypothetical protein